MLVGSLKNDQIGRRCLMIKLIYTMLKWVGIISWSNGLALFDYQVG